MNKNNQLTMLFAGIGIGAAAALLLAPCSGTELRKGIRKRADDAQDSLKKQVDELGDCVENAADAFRGRARDVVESVAEAATSATGEIRNRAKVLARSLS